ncbi:hypothetical protein CWATWH0005_3228 [Crocosphaera watsonii WH 0005]|uniref:Uncharacterized protein n=1 Tax=Crocosphaera watsonii WH 0005 TaxID=423472 RepID=T2IVC7_CROWT|nr:hypothetical protein CWATWH0005_3228 [Crocosphaera watsonii WH 0005]
MVAIAPCKCLPRASVSIFTLVPGLKELVDCVKSGFCDIN